MSPTLPKQRKTSASAAEQLVAGALQRAGWRIVAQNFRRIGCELDLVAAKGMTLAVIEVKARKRLPEDGRTLEGLLPHAKRVALRRGAAAFLSHYGRTGLTIRFDLAVVATIIPPGGQQLVYFVNIFE